MAGTKKRMSFQNIIPFWIGDRQVHFTVTVTMVFDENQDEILISEKVTVAEDGVILQINELRTSDILTLFNFINQCRRRAE